MAQLWMSTLPLKNKNYTAYRLHLSKAKPIPIYENEKMENV